MKLARLSVALPLVFALQGCGDVHLDVDDDIIEAAKNKQPLTQEQFSSLRNVSAQQTCSFLANTAYHGSGTGTRDNSRTAERAIAENTGWLDYYHGCYDGFTNPVKTDPSATIPSPDQP